MLIDVFARQYRGWLHVVGTDRQTIDCFRLLARFTLKNYLFIYSKFSPIFYHLGNHRCLSLRYFGAATATASIKSQSATVVGSVESYSLSNGSYAPRRFIWCPSSLGRGCGSSLHFCLCACCTCSTTWRSIPSASRSDAPSFNVETTPSTGHILPPSTTVTLPPTHPPFRTVFTVAFDSPDIVIASSHHRQSCIRFFPQSRFRALAICKHVLGRSGRWYYPRREFAKLNRLQHVHIVENFLCALMRC